MEDYQFAKDARLRLRDGVDPTFYNGLAKVGNEGWVAARRHDNLGYPEIFIHWDPEHWAYNHQPDCWTYEGHFELVEEPRMDKKNDRRQALNELAAGFAAQLAQLMDGDNGDDDSSDDKPEVSIDGEVVPDVLSFGSRKERFGSKVEEAIELLRQPDTDAFLLTTIRRPEDHEELRAQVAHDSLSPESEAAIGAQLAHLAAQYHEAAVILSLYTLAEKKQKSHGQSE